MKELASVIFMRDLKRRQRARIIRNVLERALLLRYHEKIRRKERFENHLQLSH